MTDKERKKALVKYRERVKTLSSENKSMRKSIEALSASLKTEKNRNILLRLQLDEYENIKE